MRAGTLAGAGGQLALLVPLAMWIVFSAGGRDSQQTEDFVRSSMVARPLATVMFVIGCRYGLSQQWPLPAVIVLASGVWGVLVTRPYVVRRLR